MDEVVTYARAGGSAKLDIRRTAARLSVNITDRDLGRDLLGLTLDDRQVLLHKDLGGAKRAFVFAHELAHVLHRRGSFRSVTRRDEEWFADWFARELVLPRRAVTRAWHDGRLAALHLDYNTVALQLAVMGAAPPLMRNRDRVLCRLCGTTQHRWPCQCAAWRHEDHEQGSALPDVRGCLGISTRSLDDGVDAQLRIDGVVFLLQAKGAPARADYATWGSHLRDWTKRVFGETRVESELTGRGRPVSCSRAARPSNVRSLNAL